MQKSSLGKRRVLHTPSKPTAESRPNEQQNLVREQKATLTQINTILQAAGIKEINLITFAGLSPEQQKEYMETQTKPLIERVPEEFRDKLKQYYEKMESITLEIIGPLPELPEKKELDEETADLILLEAGGDPIKAREIAKKRGYEF